MDDVGEAMQHGRDLLGMDNEEMVRITPLEKEIVMLRAEYRCTGYLEDPQKHIRGTTGQFRKFKFTGCMRLSYIKTVDRSGTSSTWTFFGYTFLCFFVLFGGSFSSFASAIGGNSAEISGASSISMSEDCMMMR